MAKAVIFDMNGVIINDERIHQEAWRQFCKKHGFLISKEEFKHNVFGRTEKEILEYLFRREMSDGEIEKYSNERVDVAIEIFKPKLKMTEGLAKLLEELKKTNVPLAIATSSRIRYTNFILDGLEIRNYFKVVVTSQDISKGKPDPEIYLKTSNLLGISPAGCVVFEDTISGISSGKAAGMKVIAIATTHKEDELGLADSVIETFNDINSEELAGL